MSEEQHRESRRHPIRLLAPPGADPPVQPPGHTPTTMTKNRRRSPIGSTGAAPEAVGIRSAMIPRIGLTSRPDSYVLFSGKICWISRTPRQS